MYEMLPSMLGSASVRAIWLAAYCPLPVSMILPHGCFSEYGIGTSLGGSLIDRNRATIHFKGFENAKIAASLDADFEARVKKLQIEWSRDI